jgi:hypothetical protein
MRGNYWSCSKFADWLLGTPKPPAGTAEEWNAWHKKAKAKNLRYWLAEEGLDYLQNLLHWPADRIADVRHYIRNRWISKTHALASNLKRGQWHEFETRLLHAAFDELVNFVEIEEAWMHVICSGKEWKIYKNPWYRSVFRVWRCSEAGVAHLNWAAGLKHDEEWDNKNDPSFGQPTSQALAAQEILALYRWWKDERSKRPDPMDASGLSSYYDERQKAAEIAGDEPLWSSLLVNEKDSELYRKMSDICHQMEKEQDEEDTAMLIRLVKIRHSMWT